MSDILLVTLLTIVGFLAVILSLAANKATNSKIIGICGSVAIVTGILFYSYGYSYAEGFSLTVVIKSLLASCRMFSGVFDFNLVKDTPLFASPVIVLLFWIGHFSAFYMTASAAVRILGKSVLRSMRTRMLRKGDIRLVYEAAPDSICLVGERTRKNPILLVNESSDDRAEALADSLGCTVFSGGIAQCSDQKFMKTMGMRGSKRKLDVFCISEDPIKNLRYAQALLPALQKQDVPPEALSLFMLDIPEDRASRLLAVDGRYGYGALFACSQYDLISQLIIEKRPPWSLLRFDGTGRAENNFCVFIVGFGRMGQSVLKQMLISGQMEGSTFHAEVFDRRMHEERGIFDNLCPALLNSYDVVLHEAAANSELFNERLKQNPPSMVVFCTGDHKQNMELCGIIYHKYGLRPNRPCLIQCTPDSVMIAEEEYRLQQIHVREMDRAAMQLNHVFRGGPSVREDWNACNVSSRISCRASVAFFPAHLHAAGVTSEEAMDGKWPPSPEVLENLARTEHLRWCAFYLSMGYTRMEKSELMQRCELYRQGKIQNIPHNAVEATHARLVPWEELDELSSLISGVTGETIDYKAIDRNNVLAIPEILRQAASDDRP